MQLHFLPRRGVAHPPAGGRRIGIAHERHGVLRMAEEALGKFVRGGAFAHHAAGESVNGARVEGDFPAAFARLGVALHIPLSLVLIGIVLRGSAFTFWRYGGETDAEQRHWGVTFAAASLITPLLLGVTVGAVAADAVSGPRAPGTPFFTGYVAPWLTPFALSVGVFALVAFAFLAAVYLTLEAKDRELQEDFRRRALGAGLALFGAAVVVLVLSGSGAPRVRAGLILASWAAPLHLVTAAAAIAALVALWRRRYGAARVAPAVQVSLILWGWGLSQ